MSTGQILIYTFFILETGSEHNKVAYFINHQSYCGPRLVPFPGNCIPLFQLMYHQPSQFDRSRLPSVTHRFYRAFLLFGELLQLFFLAVLLHVVRAESRYHCVEY